MNVNSLPKTVTRQRRGYDLNQSPEIQTDVVTVAADQSFLSFVCSPVLASVGFCFGKSEVYFYGPLCGEGNAIGRVRSFFSTRPYILNQLTLNLMFCSFMDHHHSSLGIES